MHRVLHAGLVAAAVSGLPSTAIALARGDDVLEGARAAGKLLLPHESRPLPLLAAAVPVHLAISLGWAVVLERVLPRGREPLGRLLGGLAIAALDLGVIGRRLPPIRALPQRRQWADHAAYGLAVGAVLARRRRAPRWPRSPSIGRSASREWSAVRCFGCGRREARVGQSSVEQGSR